MSEWCGGCGYEFTEFGLLFRQSAVRIWLEIPDVFRMVRAGEFIANHAFLKIKQIKWFDLFILRFGLRRLQCMCTLAYASRTSQITLIIWFSIAHLISPLRSTRQPQHAQQLPKIRRPQPRHRVPPSLRGKPLTITPRCTPAQNIRKRSARIPVQERVQEP